MGKGHEMECTIKMEVDEEVTVKLEPKESLNDSVTRVFNNIEKAKTCKEMSEKSEQSDGFLTNLNEALGCEVEVTYGVANFIPINAQTESSWVSDMEFELCGMTEMTEMDDIVSNAMEEISKYDPYRDDFRGYKETNSPINKTEDSNYSSEKISSKQKSGSCTDHIILKDNIDNNTEGQGNYNRELEIDLSINEVAGEEPSTTFLESLPEINTTCTFDTEMHSVDKPDTNTVTLAEVSKPIESAAPVKTTDNKSSVEGNDLNNSDFKSHTITRNDISDDCFKLPTPLSGAEVSSVTSKDLNMKHIAEEFFVVEYASSKEFISQNFDSEGDAINTADTATLSGNENSTHRLKNKTANIFDTQENTIGSAELNTNKLTEVSVSDIITIQPLDQNDSTDTAILSERSTTHDVKQDILETEHSKQNTVESTENSERIAEKTKHTLRSFYHNLYRDVGARKVINPSKRAEHFNICGALNKKFDKSIRCQSSIHSSSQFAGQCRSQGVLELNNSFQIELGSLSLEELGNLLSPASRRTSTKIRVSGEDQNSRQSAFTTPSKQTRNQSYTSMHRFQNPYKLTCRKNMSFGENNKMSLPRAEGNLQIYSNISNENQINIGLRRCSAPRVNNQILPIDQNLMGNNINVNNQIPQEDNNNYDQINTGCNVRSRPTQRHQLYQRNNCTGPRCNINSTTYMNHHSHKITTAVNQIRQQCNLSSVTHKMDQIHQNSSALSLISPRDMSHGQDQIHQYNSAFSRVGPGDMPNGHKKIHQSSPSFNGISPECNFGPMPREHDQGYLHSTGISPEGAIGSTPYRQVQNHQSGNTPNWISPGYSMGLQRNGHEQTHENSNAFNRTSPGGIRNRFPHNYSQIHNTSATFTNSQGCTMSPNNHGSSQTTLNSTTFGCRDNTQIYQGGMDNTITNFSEFENNPLSQIADQLYYEAS